VISQEKCLGKCYFKVDYWWLIIQLILEFKLGKFSHLLANYWIRWAQCCH